MDPSPDQPIIDKEILFRLTGQSEITDPSIAQQLLASAREEESKSQRAYRATTWPYWHRAIRMLPVLFRLPPLAIGVASGAIAAFALALPGIFILDAGPLSLLVLLLAAGLFGAGMVFEQLDEAGETIETRPIRRRELFALARSARRSAFEKLEHARAEVARFIRLIDGIERARNRELERLLAVNYDQLDGKPFEHFLETVFRRLGYRVEPIGKTGDQGVDLILHRDDFRIAVQAKRYAGTVGNKAVQEAIAGRVFYRCDACAVVTNSSFTISAKELAARAGCRLVGGDELRALIRGEIRL
jgi:HJR/Mrr/RecB family endonuclease